MTSSADVEASISEDIAGAKVQVNIDGSAALA
jgi:hypothetical protein